MIRERLAPLPPSCRDALEVAAVLGRDFDYPPLAAALQASPEAAVAALDPAVTARLVHPVPARAGSYRFAHTLIRDAVEDQLTPSRRADLHARVFAGLRDTGAGQATDLAHHAVRARPRVSDEEAAQAARSAAEAADLLLAFPDAATWWQTAITLTRRRDGLDTDLEMRLGRSLLLAGQVGVAREHFEAAADEAARCGDGAALAAAALAAGDTVAEVAADHRLVALLDRARRQPGLPPGTQARLAARWAIATYWQPGGQEKSRRASATAVTLAEQAGDTEAPGAALIARQFTLRGPAALPRDSLYLASVAILAEAVVSCRAAGLAQPILAELAPYRGRNLIQGVPVGWGAADWYIARLQWLLGLHDDAVRSAAAAQRLHARWGAGGLGDPLAGLGREPAAAPLSRREAEVIGLLAAGRENAEIAAALGVSVHTVERHVANIFVKIGVRNRAEATAWAHRRGLAG